MIITPASPMVIASQRRQPTFSPRNSAAAIVTVSGNAWKIAVTLASGICFSAVRKPMVAPSSPATRSATRPRSRGAMLTISALLCHASSAISGTVINPRRKIA